MGKQSRPALVLALLLLYLPKRLKPVAPIALFALIFLNGGEYFALYALAPAALALMNSNFGYEHKDLSIFKPSLRMIPLLVLFARNTYVFGRPLGSSMVDIAFTLGMYRHRLLEARVFPPQIPSSYLFNAAYTLGVLLAAYTYKFNTSITQGYAIAFVNKRDDAIAYLLANAVLIWSIFAFVYPRQAMAFRVYLVAITLRDKRNVVLRIPGMYFMLTAGESYDVIKEFSQILDRVAIFVLLVIIIHFSFRFLTRFYRPSEKLLRALIIIAFTTTAVVVSTSDRVGYYLDRTEFYQYAAERLLNYYGHGALLTTFTPGYLEAFLTPDLRIYQLERVYEYPDVEAIWKAETLSDLVSVLMQKQIVGYIYAFPTLTRVSYFTTMDLFKTNFLIARLIMSNACSYTVISKGKFGLYALKFGDLSRDAYLVYVQYPTGDKSVIIYGNGLTTSSDEKDFKVALISTHKLIASYVALFTPMGLIEFKAMNIEQVAPERFLIHFPLPLELENIQIAYIKVITTAGEVLLYP